MKEWLKQKPLVITGLVLLIAVAAYANLRGIWSEDSAATSAGAESAVIAARTSKTSPTPAPDASQQITAKPTATPEGAAAPDVSQSDSRFTQIRAERTAAREELIADLDALISRSGTDKDVRKAAEKERLEMVKWMDAEAAIEDVLKSSGYSNALATIRDGSVNVVVQVASMEQEAAVRIIELCKRETGFNAQEIKILIAK